MITVYSGAHLARNLQPTAEDVLGMLPDAIECTVKRDTSGCFELSLVYPEWGANAEALQINNWIKSPVGGSLGDQHFRIAQIQKSYFGNIEVSALHTTYNSAAILCAPFSSIPSPGEVVTGFFPWHSAMHTAMGEIDADQVGNFMVTGFTDEMEVNASEYDSPVSMRQAILDAVADRDIILKYQDFQLLLWQPDTISDTPSFRVRYGRDMLSMDTSLDSTDFYTHVMPYYIVDERMVSHQMDVYPLAGLPAEYSSFRRVQAVNLGDYYSGLETEYDQSVIQSIIDDWLEKHPWTPFPDSLAVDQIPYEGNSYELGAWGNIYFDPTGTVIQSHIVSLTYDVRLGKVTEIGLNRRQKDITDTIAGLVNRR